MIFESWFFTNQSPDKSSVIPPGVNEEEKKKATVEQHTVVKPILQQKATQNITQGVSKVNKKIVAFQAFRGYINKPISTPTHSFTTRRCFCYAVNDSNTK
jgi:hypothetical protein